MAAVQAAPANVQAEVESFSDIEPQLKKFLYDQNNPAIVKNTFESLEKNLNVPREKIFYGFCGALALYLVIGAFAEFVCNLIGFGYPAYASVKAIRTETKDDDTMWLIYWTVFASFSLLDFFAEGIMGIFPIYWLAKACFLLYLALPQTRGAIKLYVKVVDPLCTKLEALVVNYASGAAAKTSSSRGSVRTAIPT
ncbi:TB2/DP1 proteinHVA22 family protein [Aphelenchoides avenae]|nr:TB2/DP1 proteinHVA22 family protein [Aphelenchus avenae]